MNKELIYRLRAVASAYQRAEEQPVLINLLNDAADTLEKCFERIEEIDKIADVMIGNGPGAVEAYRHETVRGIRGLPNEFRHLVNHAKAIREIIQGLK